MIKYEINMNKDWKLKPVLMDFKKLILATISFEFILGY